MYCRRQTEEDFGPVGHLSPIFLKSIDMSYFKYSLEPAIFIRIESSSVVHYSLPFKWSFSSILLRKPETFIGFKLSSSLSIISSYYIGLSCCIYIVKSLSKLGGTSSLPAWPNRLVLFSAISVLRRCSYSSLEALINIGAGTSISTSYT